MINNKSKPKAVVLTGFGLNCEKETAYVLEKSGAVTDLVHINDVASGEVKLDNYQILALIGGFAFGDHIASGRVLTIKFKYKLSEQLQAFISKDSLVVGICNGFQTLVKLGILPGNEQFEGKQVATLTHNDKAGYRDDWVYLKANRDSPCVFSRGIDYIDVPVRHGEGKFLTLNDDVLKTVKENNQIVFHYADPSTGEPAGKFPYNPNGSTEAIAAICSANGRIFGIMPHPEAFLAYYNHPLWYENKKPESEEGAGMKMFRNAVEYYS